jgi:nicotinamide phosphoribosyltransferase
MFAPISVLLTDFYKQCHAEQYDPSVTKVVSYYVPRKTRISEFDKVVVFGIQAFIKEYLIEYMNENFFNRSKEEVLLEYESVIAATMGTDRVNSEKIEKLYDLGYLPIEICALPEGYKIGMNVPCIEISNTHPDFAWCTNFIETIMLSELWYPMCVATAVTKYRDIVNKYYDKTSCISGRSAISEFGFRSLIGLHGAIKASSAFLLSFNKTATIPGIMYVSKYYNTPVQMVGGGMASTEHSVMCSSAMIDGSEIPSIKRLLTEVYPKGSFSMVCDSYDYWNVVDTILPSLKEEIVSRDGTLFVRGDSGDPVEIVTETVFSLWDTFGGTINEKGYKVLDPHIRAIYGDGITQNRAEQIYKILEEKGFSAENVALGAGGFSMLSYMDAEGNVHMFSRDTFNVAIKCSYVETTVEGVVTPIKVFKDPKTDSGMKKSHKGCCAVFYNHVTKEFDCDDNMTLKEAHSDPFNLLRPIFKDGKMIEETNFSEIRRTLWNGKF